MERVRRVFFSSAAAGCARHWGPLHTAEAHTDGRESEGAKGRAGPFIRARTLSGGEVALVGPRRHGRKTTEEPYMGVPLGARGASACTRAPSRAHALAAAVLAHMLSAHVAAALLLQRHARAWLRCRKKLRRKQRSRAAKIIQRSVRTWLLLLR